MFPLRPCMVLYSTQSETNISHVMLKTKKTFVLFIYFIVESWLTSFASPMFVFYSIFNEMIPPSEKFYPIDSMVKQGVQMK